MEKGQKTPANIPQLCHLIYPSDFCVWEGAVSLNFFLIFLEKDDWTTASRPKQSCAADICLFLVQLAPPSLHYCVAHGLRFWWAQWNHWAPEMTAMFSITCWIKERLLCLGVLLQHFVSFNVRPQGLIREKQMAHAFLLSFYLFSRGWFPFHPPP